MNHTDIATTYVRLWNDPDEKARRRAVRELWAPGGRQVLLAPQEMREQAAPLGFPAPLLEVCGHEELDARVTRAYEEFVGSGKFVFRLREAPVRLQDAVSFGWEMVPAGGGEPAGGGREFLLLDADERIRVDYQFID
ncbi:MAG: hypothetical protein ACXVRH_09460 [Thermoleophilaceae bacterium]